MTFWQAARHEMPGGRRRHTRTATLTWLLGSALCCTALAVAAATATAAPRIGGGAGCVPPRQMGVVFVVDDSGSNDANDPAELGRDAALTGIASLPTGSLASVSTFSGTATTRLPTSTLTDADRAGTRTPTSWVRSNPLGRGLSSFSGLVKPCPKPCPRLCESSRISRPQPTYFWLYRAKYNAQEPSSNPQVVGSDPTGGSSKPLQMDDFACR